MKGKIFNSEEVQAIIAGKKTMFREVVKPQPVYKENCFFYRDSGYSVGLYNLFLEKILQDNPYQVGETIFVKGQESPITLKIKRVKVKRLRDISKDDAIKEGFIEQDDISNPPPIEQFANYWNLTHKKQEHKWSANPWVFAYEFEIINLDK